MPIIDCDDFLDTLVLFLVHVVLSTLDLARVLSKPRVVGPWGLSRCTIVGARATMISCITLYCMTLRHYTPRFPPTPPTHLPLSLSLFSPSHTTFAVYFLDCRIPRDS